MWNALVVPATDVTSTLSQPHLCLLSFKVTNRQCEGAGAAASTLLPLSVASESSIDLGDRSLVLRFPPLITSYKVRLLTHTLFSATHLLCQGYANEAWGQRKKFVLHMQMKSAPSKKEMRSKYFVLA